METALASYSPVRETPNPLHETCQDDMSFISVSWCGDDVLWWLAVQPGIPSIVLLLLKRRGITALDRPRQNS